ncbi:hypothetical protein Y032_0022g595 [Ancylostoma ceylanicum]|nr:hypothetical protein Y032_0022g595 [Ancylostoma ceylanicum]
MFEYTDNHLDFIHHFHYSMGNGGARSRAAVTQRGTGGDHRLADKEQMNTTPIKTKMINTAAAKTNTERTILY